MRYRIPIRRVEQISLVWQGTGIGFSRFNTLALAHHYSAPE
jgi:hypothetical protein